MASENVDDDMALDDVAALITFNENNASFNADVVNIDGLNWDAELDEDSKAALKENETSKANFARLEEEFQGKKALGTTTEEDEIRYAAAKHAEQQRIKDFERSQMEIEEPVKVADQPPEDEEDSLFIPEVPERPEPPQRKKRAAAKPKNRLTAKEKNEAMSAGLDRLESGKPKRKKTQDKSAEPRKRKRPAANQKRRRPTLNNLQGLGSTNIIGPAQANAERPDMPTFTSKDKSKALQELLASIPNSEQRLHSSEKNAILEASKKFNGQGAIRSDGQGGWKLRGMESSLYHHQLLGAAFLRDREHSNTRPHGGLVCDEMGFGKTIQMIANILTGKPENGSAVKTTLIVAPPSLVNQWMAEMDKHVKDRALGRILRYHNGSRLMSNDVVADLATYDIVLTTYGEVQKSYPMIEPPKHLSSETKKNEWWKDFYVNNCGPLHKMKFHRIVLDEAHAIKNHNSKTSIAVRGLTGKFRWAITGTPILNYIEELFPYFSFLRVPHTGDYNTFCHNYCNNRSNREPVNMERIHNILRAIMLRRTHVDSLFNAPIVKLPGISHVTHEVEFNSIERAIYSMVKRRYAQQINTFSSSGNLTANYSNILSMILRLRMLCSHIFLCQETLKEMFVVADIENLWQLTQKEVETVDKGIQRSSDTFIALRKMLHSKDKTITTCQTREGDASSPIDISDIDNQEDVSTGASFGLTFKFRRFLRELSKSTTWAELHARSNCAKCGQQPDEPMCTSCFHVYCIECLAQLRLEQRDELKVACLECGTSFEETSPCSGLKELGFNSGPVVEKVERIKEKRMAAAKGRRGTSQSQYGDDEEDPGKESSDWIEFGQVLPSAKLTATKAAILNWREKNESDKIIIYTQFLGLCRILARMCEAEGWGYVNFNGKMTLEAREKAIDKFRDKPEVCIMICSLKAGGIGLNLTMASKVIILDLWFNSSVEAQAYCRAFRIGQQNKVEVLRFVVKNSIDEDLVKMQDRKDIEVSGAIGPESHGKRATVRQLLELFGSVKEGEGQNEFILVEDEEDDENDDDDGADATKRLPPRPF
ncbi:uncharacterized protein PV06_05369 [Exophiala oligosperma]|uniref:Uncharacterized protein n=1 Tax=Exophiala oligosperma TaxID=215243 RepID=A0A0D2DP98_9EURO|nr:uncharacterized protein PV06_05369 [Exophiala oligosperma]KIW44355.1 hypothetical protein PV06_05369 [Exophiala oligosperma]